MIKDKAYLGVAFGPGYPLIRQQALGSGPVSAPIPNTGCTLILLPCQYTANCKVL